MNRSRPNLFWPIILIGVGVLFLLDNAGVLVNSPWAVIWNLWPLLLIAGGVFILLGRGGAMQSGLLSGLLGLAFVIIVLVFSLIDIPGMNLGGERHTEHIEHTLGQFQSAELVFDFGSGSYDVSALNDSNNLIEGDLTYQGTLDFHVDDLGDRARVTLDKSGITFSFGIGGGDEWDVALNRNVTYDVNLDLGSGGANLDFGQLKLSGGEVDVGSGGSVINLPASGRYTLRIDGGSGGTTIRVPSDAGLRIEYDRGSGGLFANSTRLTVSGSGDFTTETPDFAAAADSITLVIDGGSGSITIEDR